MDVLSGGEKQRMAVSLLFTDLYIAVTLSVSLSLSRWLDCSIINPNLLFLMSALVQLVLMLKDLFILIVVRFVYWLLST